GSWFGCGLQGRKGGEILVQLARLAAQGIACRESPLHCFSRLMRERLSQVASCFYYGILDR
ncbi:hypothetical protein AVEN_167190-1, partial [Araneus ventricosus]